MYISFDYRLTSNCLVFDRCSSYYGISCVSEPSVRSDRLCSQTWFLPFVRVVSIKRWNSCDRGARHVLDRLCAGNQTAEWPDKIQFLSPIAFDYRRISRVCCQEYFAWPLRCNCSYRRSYKLVYNSKMFVLSEYGVTLYFTPELSIFWAETKVMKLFVRITKATLKIVICKCK